MSQARHNGLRTQAINDYMTEAAIGILGEMWLAGETSTAIAARIESLIGMPVSRQMIINQVKQRGFVRPGKEHPNLNHASIALAATERARVAAFNAPAGRTIDRMAKTNVRYPVPPGGFSMLRRRVV